jgi:hypothetical protein
MAVSARSRANRRLSRRPGIDALRKAEFRQVPAGKLVMRRCAHYNGFLPLALLSGRHYNHDFRINAPDILPSSRFLTGNHQTQLHDRLWEKHPGL